MTLEDLHQALRAHLIAPAVALPALTLPILRVMPGTGWIGYVYAGWGLGLTLHMTLSFWGYPPASAQKTAICCETDDGQLGKAGSPLPNPI